MLQKKKGLSKPQGSEGWSSEADKKLFSAPVFVQRILCLHQYN